MCIAIAREHIEYDHVEQTDDFGRRHVSPRYVEHVLQGRPRIPVWLDSYLADGGLPRAWQ